MNMKNEKLVNFVPFPRKDLSDFRAGVITPNEYDFYMRLRHSANPYAITTISTGGLVAEFHDRKWSENYITKLLLSLKKKSFIHYDSRNGRRGSFNIKFRDFLLPSGAVSKLQVMEKSGLGRGEDGGQDNSQSEEEQTIPPQSQSSKEIKDSIGALVQQMSSNKVRGSNNDTETNNEKETNRISKQLRENVSVERFKPTSYEEQRCWEIALELGEEKMDFLLGTLYKHGFGVIERAWGIYDEKPQNEKAMVLNQGAYFNKIISELLTKYYPLAIVSDL